MGYLLPRFEEVPLWPLIAGPFFLALFVFIVWWTYRRNRKPLHDEAANLPLADD